MATALTLRLMSEGEAGQLATWAAEEGWDLGLQEAAILWDHDPEAFIAAEVDGRLIGGGVTHRYGGAFGFMGCCLVRRPFRGHGYGERLWHTSVRLLQARLRAGATIGLDAPADRQEWYAKRGFGFSHRTLRHEGRVSADEIVPGVVPATEVPFEQLVAYDRQCFPAERDEMLRSWLGQPGVQALAAVDGGRLIGYGVVRLGHTGGRIGPLFADEGQVAEALFTSLASLVSAGPVCLDVPEVNAWAMALARRHRLGVALTSARMYLGESPRLAESRIFGVTALGIG